MELKMDWSEEINCQLTKETLPQDMLDRAKYADYLTTYLKQYKNESYVFNINSNWGAGKTYFIKRWANSLNTYHPVVYFNSWKFDHNNEPLILILSEIIQQLTSLIDDSKHKEQKAKLTKAVTKTIKHIAPTLAKGVFKKVSGVNWADLTDEDSEKDDNKDEIKFNSELVSVSTQAILNLHTQQQNSIDELKQQIEEILSEVLVTENTDGAKRWSPMYVFVDELDRCRPTFAIEVLEVIKHIFDIPRIMFVIATDTEQLQHSIKAVYGHDFDAEKYLMRFFNRSFALPTPKLQDYLNQLPSVTIVKELLVKTSEFNIFDIDDESAIKLICMIFESFETDLRSVNQIVERVASILTNHKNELGVILLLTLESLRVRNRSVYDDLINGRVSINIKDDYKASMFFEKLNANNENTLKLDLSPNLRNNYRSQHENITYDNDFDLHSILNILINTIAQKSKPPKFDNTRIHYFTLIVKGEGGNIQRFKDYVELAANLS